MTKKMDIPDEVIAKVRPLLKEKNDSKFYSYRLTFAAIAEACGTTENIVKCINNHGAKHEHGKVRSRLSPKEVKAIREILRKRDLGDKITYTEISDMTGASVHTIRNIHNCVIY